MITYLVKNGNMLFRVSEINIKYAQEKPSEKKKGTFSHTIVILLYISYSFLGSQAGIVDIKHAFHLYYKINVVCGLSFSWSQPDFEGFLRALRFPPSSKLTASLFQFNQMQDLPENHFRVSGASWVNIINYYFINAWDLDLLLHWFLILENAHKY